MMSSDQPLSDCHQAPVVLCEGNAWDVPLGSIKNGSTYGYGCTECHKWCDIYAATQPSSQPEPCICGYNPSTGYRMDILCPVHDKGPKPNKPLCPDAWAIPPSPRMLKNGNDYYTCSKCGEPCDVIDLKQNSPVEERVSPQSSLIGDSSIPDAQAEVGLMDIVLSYVEGMSLGNSGKADQFYYFPTESFDKMVGEIIATARADKAAAVVEVLDHLEADSRLEEQPYGQNALRARVVPVASINNERRRLARLQPPTAGEVQNNGK